MAEQPGSAAPDKQPVVTQDPVTQGTEPEKPEKTFTQKELDEIIEKRLAKERRRFTAAQRRIGELQATKPAEPGKTEDRPKRDQFDSYEEWVRAEAAYEARKVAREERQREEEERRKSFEKDSRERDERERQQRWASLRRLGQKKYADFDETISDDLTITEPMAQAISESELGHEIAYFLGKNPEEAERISDLSPIRQQIEIGKLEAKLSISNPRTSTAPPPINPLKGGGKADTNELSDDLPPEEWLRRRNAQLRKK